MRRNPDKLQKNKIQSAADAVAQKQQSKEANFQQVDTRPASFTQRKLRDSANNSQRVHQLRANQTMANQSTTDTVKQSGSSNGVVQFAKGNTLDDWREGEKDGQLGKKNKIKYLTNADYRDGYKAGYEYFKQKKKFSKNPGSYLGF